MLTRPKKQALLNTRIRKNSGYILIVTVVLLSALLIISLNYLERTADSLQLSGYNREAAESLVLAENAMNYVFGNFIYGADLDKDGNNLVDINQPININALNALPLPYLYFVTAAAVPAIDQALPSILQKIANGEARGTGNGINGHVVSANSQQLLVQNLYSATERPIVLTLGVNNELTVNGLAVTANDWANISTGAAVWFEIVQNPVLNGNFQVYIQVVSKVGNAKSYSQRLILNLNITLGNNIATFGQSS